MDTAAIKIDTLSNKGFFLYLFRIHQIIDAVFGDIGNTVLRIIEVLIRTRAVDADLIGIFIFCQKFFVQGLTAGGVKG